ncbi:phage gp36-like protein [Arthrobacter sp. V1I9]|uniref:phage protein Gp36 family protein n=1 Tax=Arthrobacter sp. V1I9 TaxID=3042275 RepID=UPI00278FA808|nr:phage protein Gp36 family protein [Arthrobacter sp. V1I9]MDQ0869046.1 phage gp36-like protein [Arthrobacter sp. V1I9]
MSTTLQIESFGEINLRERTELSADYAPETLVLEVKSSEGYAPGQTIYVGLLSREGVEKAVIDSVVDATTIGLTQALKLPHTRYEPVTAVLGDLIHVYRAANSNGSVPADDAFTVLATRSINADHQSTYFTDSAGNSDFWYRFTYYNATTLDETDLADSEPVRGDDFGHYVSVSEIRNLAGFENAFNLKDVTIDHWRRAAETEINSALAGAYTVPFNPVPALVKSLTLELAAALLLADAYGSGAYGTRLKDARAKITAYGDKTAVVTDENGQSLSTSNSVTGYPDADAPRSFYVGQTF